MTAKASVKKNTIVKKITIGTPVGIGAASNGNLRNLDDVDNTNLIGVKTKIMLWDSSTSSFIFDSGGGIPFGLINSTGRIQTDAHLTLNGLTLKNSDNTLTVVDSNGVYKPFSTTEFIRTGTTVTPGIYGSGALVPILTIDSNGFIDSAGMASVSGVSSFTYDSANFTLNIGTADGGSFNARVVGEVKELGDVNKAGLNYSNKLLVYDSDAGNFIFQNALKYWRDTSLYLGG